MDRKRKSLEAVLEEAKRQFSTKPFEEVSVAEIAATARCSITTIYDVYGNKDGLYLATAQSYLKDFGTSLSSSVSGQTALERLMNFLDARVEAFSKPDLREAMRNVVTRLGGQNLQGAPRMRNMFISQLQRVIEMTQACLDEGSIRPMRADILAENIIAHVDWRPLFHALIFGAQDPLNHPPQHIVARTLLGILTEEGIAAFDRLRPGMREAVLNAPVPNWAQSADINS